MKKFIVLGAAIVMTATCAFAGGNKDNGAAAKSGTAAAPAAAAFNPDTEKDFLPYDQLEAKFGSLDDAVAKVPKDAKLGSILKDSGNLFFQGIEAGEKDEIARLNSKYGTNFTMETQAPTGEADINGQISETEGMVTKGMSALMLSPVTNDALNDPVDHAIAKGIPIVNVNCEYIAKANTFIGGLNIEIGRIGAEYIGKKLGGQGNIAIVSGVPGTFTSSQRVKGFHEVMAKEFPNIKIVAEQTGKYDTQTATDVTANILTAHPDIQAIYYCSDAMALGGVEAVRNASGLKYPLGKMIIVGVDGTAQSYASIDKGEQTATIDQLAALTGKESVDACIRLLAGQKLPRVVKLPVVAVDKANKAAVWAQYGIK
jgi:ribose transport system substrate-binding protein